MREEAAPRAGAFDRNRRAVSPDRTDHFGSSTLSTTWITPFDLQHIGDRDVRGAAAFVGDRDGVPARHRGQLAAGCVVSIAFAAARRDFCVCPWSRPSARRRR
jgi:hypothetical protein